MKYLPGLDFPLSLKALSFGFSAELKWLHQDFFTIFWKPLATHTAKGHWTQLSQWKEFPRYRGQSARVANMHLKLFHSLIPNSILIISSENFSCFADSFNSTEWLARSPDRALEFAYIK